MCAGKNGVSGAFWGDGKYTYIKDFDENEEAIDNDCGVADDPHGQRTVWTRQDVYRRLVDRIESSGLDKLNLGIQAQAGYLFEDNLMVLGNLSYQHSGYESVPDYISLGVGGRYYIVQNGIYLGVNCKLIHANHNYNDVMPGLEVGYAYFLSRTVTVEPAVYYDQSFKKHSDFSTIGFRIGIGVYL